MSGQDGIQTHKARCRQIQQVKLSEDLPGDFVFNETSSLKSKRKCFQTGMPLCLDNMFSSHSSSHIAVNGNPKKEGKDSFD